MASLITQNIGTAAASAANQTQPQAPQRDQTARPISTSEVNRSISQEASKNVAGNVRGGDQKRAVQIPKRVETPFSSKEDEKVKNEDPRDAPATESPRPKARAVA